MPVDRLPGWGEATLASFLFVLVRVASALLYVPLPGFRGMAAPPKMFLALSLTMVLLPRWPVVAGRRLTIEDVGWALPAEAVLGLTAGLAVAWVLEVFVMAMQFLSIQAGYSYASTIDPSTQADSGVLQVIAQLGAGLLFFVTGMDRWLIEAFANSLDAIPAGAFRITPEAADSLARWTGAMIALAFRLSLPVVGFLILVDVTLALLGRLQPQLPLLTLAMPLKMAATALLLAALASSFPTVLEHARRPAAEFILRMLSTPPVGRAAL